MPFETLQNDYFSNIHRCQNCMLTGDGPVPSGDEPVSYYDN